MRTVSQKGVLYRQGKPISENLSLVHLDAIDGRGKPAAESERDR